MTERKIHAMHRRFGTCGVMRCKTCKHCLCIDHHNRRYYKCELYGVSYSEATDWRLSYPACGAYNMPVDIKRWEPIITQIIRSPNTPKPIDGQLDFSSFLSKSKN